jgi:hypothetical protein
VITLQAPSLAAARKACHLAVGEKRVLASDRRKLGHAQLVCRALI